MPAFPSGNLISVYLVVLLTLLIWPIQPATHSGAGHKPLGARTQRAAAFSSVSASAAGSSSSGSPTLTTRALYFRFGHVATLGVSRWLVRVGLAVAVLIVLFVRRVDRRPAVRQRVSHWQRAAQRGGGGRAGARRREAYRFALPPAAAAAATFSARAFAAKALFLFSASFFERVASGVSSAPMAPEAGGGVLRCGCGGGGALPSSSPMSRSSSEAAAAPPPPVAAPPVAVVPPAATRSAAAVSYTHLTLPTICSV
eukprot:2752932-Prymnesium_polylepis.1